MALMLLKIQNRKLSVSSAGIPPLLIYRVRTGTIQEFKIKGMPLGAVDSFPYETITTELEYGDTVLMMTDGLPELFNKEKLSFEYSRVKAIFLQNAQKPVNEIINKLFLAGENWMTGQKQNDDITLVAFRLNDKLENFAGKN